jgi:MerR family copper efflux transcriptional regulator
MRIGELARQSGVPATALRYYEQLGLLPDPDRTESGYRAYGEEAVDRLAFIRAAQAVGLTLAEMRQVLGVRDAGEAARPRAIGPTSAPRGRDRTAAAARRRDSAR